jgi:hypothetical protein
VIWNFFGFGVDAFGKNFQPPTPARAANTATASTAMVKSLAASAFNTKPRAHCSQHFFDNLLCVGDRQNRPNCAFGASRSAPLPLMLLATAICVNARSHHARISILPDPLVSRGSRRCSAMTVNLNGCLLTDTYSRFVAGQVRDRAAFSESKTEFLAYAPRCRMTSISALKASPISSRSFRLRVSFFCNERC